MTSIFAFPTSQIRGNDFVVLTDITPQQRMAPAGIRTLQHLLGAGASSIHLVPCRFDHLHDETGTALSQAISPDEHAKIRIHRNASAYFTGLQPRGFFFVNDVFPHHPAALEICARYGTCDSGTAVAVGGVVTRLLNSDEEIYGYGFSHFDKMIWPLKKKTVLLLTDASDETDHALMLCTVSNLTREAKSVCVVVVGTDAKEAAPKIADALNVPISGESGDSLPTQPFGSTWLKAVSVFCLPTTTASSAMPHHTGELSADTNAVRHCAKVAHVFVNDCREMSNRLADVATDMARDAACGVLRQAALTTGAFRRHQEALIDWSRRLAQEQRFELATGNKDPAAVPAHLAIPSLGTLDDVWPVKHNRFLFVVEDCVLGAGRGKSWATDAQQLLTMRGIGQIRAKGGVSVVVPVCSKHSPELFADEERVNKALAHFKALLPAQDKSNNSAEPAVLFVPTLNEFKKIEAKRQLPPGTIIVIGDADMCAGAGDETELARQADKVAESVDVVVFDLSLVGACMSIEKHKGVADLFVSTTRRLHHLVIGPTCLNVGVAPGLDHLAEDVQRLRSKNQQQGGGAPGDEDLRVPSNVVHHAMSSFNYRHHDVAVLETLAMRKPVCNGSGSLLANLAASLATTILLHPLQLYLYAVPNPDNFRFGASFLRLRCAHAVIRELVYHRMSRGLEHRPDLMAFGGLVGSLWSGVATEPVRALAYGSSLVGAVPNALAGPNLIPTIAMNLAPQVSFQLSAGAAKIIKRTFGVRVRRVPSLVFLLSALARIVTAFALHRVAMSRSYAARAGTVGPRLTTGCRWFQVYALKEVLALIIETLVQKYFK